MRRYGAIVLCAVSLMATGCSTIMEGTHRDVAITSDPGNVRVTIDGEPKGTTPLVARLWRGGAHVVKFERDGYEPIEQSITRDFSSSWAAGNALLGPFGLFGYMIDTWTGAAHDLSHKRLIANFPTHHNGKTPSLTSYQDTAANSAAK